MPGQATRVSDHPAAPHRTGVRRPPRRAHNEHHFDASDTVRDVIIGMSDGLTVPFALAAGISGAIAASHIVVTAGIAELAAGGISMGGLTAGGLAGAIFAGYGISGDPLKQLVDTVTADKKHWVDFMMRFELGLEKPDPRRAPLSALRIGGSYVIGGLLPLVPYMLVPRSQQALWGSIVVTFIALVLFGALKGKFTGTNVVRSAVETAAIGGVAAAVAFALARLVSGSPA